MVGDTKSSLGGRDSPNQAGKARTADSGSRNSAELGVTTELAELRAGKCAPFAVRRAPPPEGAPRHVLAVRAAAGVREGKLAQPVAKKLQEINEIKRMEFSVHSMAVALTFRCADSPPSARK